MITALAAVPTYLVYLGRGKLRLYVLCSSLILSTVTHTSSPCTARVHIFLSDNRNAPPFFNFPLLCFFLHVPPLPLVSRLPLDSLFFPCLGFVFSSLVISTFQPGRHPIPFSPKSFPRTGELKNGQSCRLSLPSNQLGHISCPSLGRTSPPTLSLPILVEEEAPPPMLFMIHLLV